MGGGGALAGLCCKACLLVRGPPPATQVRVTPKTPPKIGSARTAPTRALLVRAGQEFRARMARALAVLGLALVLVR